MRLRRGDAGEGTVRLADLLRRLAARGVEITPFEDGYQLARGIRVEVYFFGDPVSEAEVRRVAELFELSLLQLYFDRTERDSS